MGNQNQRTTTAYLYKYLQLGFYPIPVQGKVARYHWKDYQLNPQDFTRPGINIGLRANLLPSGDYLWFVDLDSKELLSSFYESHPTLMCAPLVSTGKGWHIYLTWKEPVRTRHFKGIDIIANGYVVAPPSIHSNGHVYKFIIPLRGLPPTYNPEWLSINQSPPNQSSLTPARIKQTVQAGSAHTHIPPGVPQGQRHNTLIYFLGILFAAHLTEEEALAKAIEWNRLNRPPLSIQEVRFTVRSCYEKWDIFTN